MTYWCNWFTTTLLKVIKLIPNSHLLEMNGPAQVTLEPLKEHFEEEEQESNSEDEGLNMKEIQMEVNIESSCKK